MNQKRVWLGALVLVGAAFGLVSRLTQRLVVEGSSMSPTLRPGDRLLAVRHLPIRPGDVVAAEDPRHPGRLVIKRVASVDRHTGHILLTGDNPAGSTDSRHYGPVKRSAIRSRAVFRYAPEPPLVVVSNNVAAPRVAGAKEWLLGFRPVPRTGGPYQP